MRYQHTHKSLISNLRPTYASALCFDIRCRGERRRNVALNPTRSSMPVILHSRSLVKPQFAPSFPIPTYPIKIAMLLCLSLNGLLELLKRTTRTRPTPTLRQRSWRSTRDEPNIRLLLRSFTANARPTDRSLTDHLLHAYMGQEGYEIVHLPCPFPLHVVSRGSVTAAASAGVEDPQGRGNDERDFWVMKLK